MPKVIFHTDFFDNNRRYRTGIEYDIADDVVLPTRGIEVIEEEEERPARRRSSVKSEE
jgi:hypothetical protein